MRERLIYPPRGKGLSEGGARTGIEWEEARKLHYCPVSLPLSCFDRLLKPEMDQRKKTNGVHGPPAASHLRATSQPRTQSSLFCWARRPHARDSLHLTSFVVSTLHSAREITTLSSVSQRLEKVAAGHDSKKHRPSFFLFFLLETHRVGALFGASLGETVVVLLAQHPRS